jgi:hypothetical protein
MAIGFVTKNSNVTTISSTDSGWQDYLMSLFDKKELVDGYPTVNGLRRVSEKILGNFIAGRTNVVQSPSENCGTAVVEYEVSFQKDKNSPVISFSSAADANYENTDKIFRCYLTAIAETRAEARALRKALKLNKASIEELSKVAELDKDIPTPANSLQVRAVKNIIKTRKLDINTIAKDYGLEVDNNELILTTEEASKLIKELQK